MIENLCIKDSNIDNKNNNNKKSIINTFQRKIIYKLIILSYLKPISSQQNKSKFTKLGYNNKKLLI